MRDTNKIFSIVYLFALALCGVGTFLPFHNSNLPDFMYVVDDWRFYRLLFFIVIVNMLFVIFKTHIKMYCFFSIVLLEFSMLFFKTCLNSLYHITIISDILVYILILVFVVLILRPNWNAVFLTNCFIIFMYISFFGLYYSNFFSSYRSSALEVVIRNVGNFKFSDAGYFLSNAGVAIAILSGLFHILLNITTSHENSKSIV